MTPEQELSYLAAFIDAEGWITFIPYKTRNKANIQLGFTNTNETLFFSVIDMAKRADITFRIEYRRTANSKHSNRFNAYLSGGRPSFERFASLVPILHPDKKLRLASILARYHQVSSEGRVRSKPIYNSEYIAKRAHITRKANAARWAGHVAIKPRQRPSTPEQRERRNFLARQRRFKPLLP